MKQCEIINKDNINIFEGLVCPTENLNRLYRMTEDGTSRKTASKNKELMITERIK